MKALILLCLVVAAHSTSILYQSDFKSSPSDANKETDGKGNYAFSHHDPHLGAPSYHKESGNIQGHKFGSYGTRGLDGKVHIVDYVADHEGFKPTIRTSERLTEDHRDSAGVKTTELKPVSIVYNHPYPLPRPQYYIVV